MRKQIVAVASLEADDVKIHRNQDCEAQDHHRKEEASHHLIMSRHARAPEWIVLGLIPVQRFLVDFQFLNQYVETFQRKPVSRSRA
jgi:hypothetical protein